jgi:hypothetical protein
MDHRTAPARTRPDRYRAPAGHVLVTGLVCFGLATFLNAGALLETAERQEFGTAMRDVTVGVMDRVHQMSEVLLLDRPRAALDRALGRADDPAPDPEPTEPTVLRSLETQAGGTGGDDAAATATTTTTLPPPATRAATESDPVKLWVIGDSFVELFGPALGNDADATGVIVPEVDFRFESGLIRDDYFDWPEHMQSRLPVVEPDMVVVTFGGNDGQPIVVDGVLLEPETPAWLDVYHERVGEAMDVLLTGTTRVYWIGLPIMPSDEFNQRVLTFNEVYRSEAALRPGVTYIDVFDLFKDENGEYSKYLRTESGDLVEMRSFDTYHYSWNGAYRLSEFVLETIAPDWGFTDRL